MLSDRAGGANDPVRGGIPIRTACVYGVTSGALHSSEVVLQNRSKVW